MERFRTTQNWIGKSLNEAVYIPPSPIEVPTLLESWLVAANSSLDTIEKIIECYVHLLAIHPFADANGRIARALVDVISSRVLPESISITAYKIGIAPEISRSGYQAFGIASHEGVMHQYWQSAIAWTNTATTLAHQLINEYQEKLHTKLGIFQVSKIDLQVINCLWDNPITTVQYLQTKLNLSLREVTFSLQNLCRLNIVLPKKLKYLPSQAVFTCPIIFECFDRLEQLIVNKS